MNVGGFGRAVEILLVEDSQTDILLAQEAFKDAKLDNRVHVVTDGQAAMAFLRKEGEYEKAPQPDLVLLDLNLPLKDGREVLAEIKGDPQLKQIPVVILTTSDQERDIFKTYDLHANSYITKPVDFEKFIDVIQAIESFWFTVVKLPPK